MTMSQKASWEDIQKTGEWTTEVPAKGTSEERPPHKSPAIGSLEMEQNPLSSSSEIWLNPTLHSHEATANLDHQQPVTLFFLGLVKSIPQVVQVYVEELRNGGRKHWTILNERDYDAMDTIYEIEEKTLDRFPTANLSFRVTLLTEGGPSISNKATKIYDDQ